MSSSDGRQREGDGCLSCSGECGSDDREGAVAPTDGGVKARQPGRRKSARTRAFYPGPLNDGFGKIIRESGGAGSRTHVMGPNRNERRRGLTHQTHETVWTSRSRSIPRHPTRFRPSVQSRGTRRAQNLGPSFDRTVRRTLPGLRGIDGCAAWWRHDNGTIMIAIRARDLVDVRRVAAGEREELVSDALRRSGRQLEGSAGDFRPAVTGRDQDSKSSRAPVDILLAVSIALARAREARPWDGPERSASWEVDAARRLDRPTTLDHRQFGRHGHPPRVDLLLHGYRPRHGGRCSRHVNLERSGCWQVVDSNGTNQVGAGQQEQGGEQEAQRRRHLDTSTDLHTSLSRRQGLPTGMGS